MNFAVITQEEYLNSELPPKEVDVVAQLINKKLAAKGRTDCIVENFDHNVLKIICDGIDCASENGMLEGILQNGGTLQITTNNYDKHSNGLSAQKTSEAQKKPKSKRESDIRSFFEQHFKENVYKVKKEEIIKIVLEAKSKSEVNNKLMDIFKGEELKHLYRELKTLIKDLPGK